MIETLNNAMQKYEGSYRAELAMLVRRFLPIAAARGETVQLEIHRRQYRSIDKIWGMQNRVSAAYLAFNQVYTYITQKIVAYLPNLPAYMQGSISFRSYVTGSELASELINDCSWLIQVMPDVANLRANANRVVELADAIERVQEAQAFYRETGVCDFIYDSQPATEGLSVRGLELMFAGQEAQPFLRLARLDVKPGQWIFVRGPSGSGKSCLIKALNGLWPYGRGRVSMPAGLRTLYACQDTRLPQASLKQLISVPDDADDRRDIEVASVMSAVGLGDFIENMGNPYYKGRRWDDVLSGGQKQKIVLARILLHRPDVLFLDEATRRPRPGGAHAVPQADQAALPACHGAVGDARAQPADRRLRPQLLHRHPQHRERPRRPRARRRAGTRARGAGRPPSSHFDHAPAVLTGRSANHGLVIGPPPKE